MPPYIKKADKTNNKDNGRNDKQEYAQVKHFLKGFYSYDRHPGTQHHYKGSQIGEKGSLIGHPGAIYSQPVTGDKPFLNF